MTSSDPFDPSQPMADQSPSHAGGSPSSPSTGSTQANPLSDRAPSVDDPRFQSTRQGARSPSRPPAEPSGSSSSSRPRSTSSDRPSSTSHGDHDPDLSREGSSRRRSPREPGSFSRSGASSNAAGSTGALGGANGSEGSGSSGSLGSSGSSDPSRLSRSGTPIPTSSRQAIAARRRSDPDVQDRRDYSRREQARDYRTQDPDSRSRSNYSTYGSYGSNAGGGGDRGSGDNSRWGGGLPTNLTALILVGLVAFFGGFAARDFYAERGGFDDTRIVMSEEVPIALRNFCTNYNGYPSFTVVQLNSISTLTMAVVPVLKLDTCTIPVRQTANALQALGVQERSNALGPQLGGSNLTLIEFPVARNMARSLYDRFPEFGRTLGGEQRLEEEVLVDLEDALNDALGSDVVGFDMGALAPTSMSGVYVMIPGHSFNLQPQLPR